MSIHWAALLQLNFVIGSVVASSDLSPSHCAYPASFRLPALPYPASLMQGDSQWCSNHCCVCDAQLASAVHFSQTLELHVCALAQSSEEAQTDGKPQPMPLASPFVTARGMARTKALHILLTSTSALPLCASSSVNVHCSVLTSKHGCFIGGE